MSDQGVTSKAESKALVYYIALSLVDESDSEVPLSEHIPDI